jgi:hypothetical protein
VLRPAQDYVLAVTLDPILIRTVYGDEFPPPEHAPAAEIVGEDEDNVTKRCHEGLIETMPRIGTAR